MKTELVALNETRKHMRVEIPREIVDAEIDRVARGYSQKARVPGFRPGRTPARVIKQRYKDQILHEVAHELVSRAVDEALRERGVEPVETPDVRDVTVEEGRPLTFTASFETVPAFDPGDFSTVALGRPTSRVEEPAVAEALERLRQRAARYEPVEHRGVLASDTVVVDLVRRPGRAASPEREGTEPPAAERHEHISVELGSSANPPGFDEQLLGMEAGATRTFTIDFPGDYGVAQLAGKAMTYTVTVTAIKQRVVPALDDELAKDLGEFQTLEDLRARVRQDLERDARHAADRELRGELTRQLAARVPFEVPSPLVEREIERRVEDFATRLLEQRIDPGRAGIDWDAFRENQRDAARQAVAAAIVLDEVAKREGIEASDEEAELEVRRHAERTGRTPAAVRAEIEKGGGVARVYTGLRREKTVDFIMARATIQ